MLKSKRFIGFILFVANILLTCTAFEIMSLFVVNKWVGVGVGSGLIVIDGILALIFKDKVYWAAFTVNGFAVGIVISSLYTFLAYFPPLWQIALVGLGTVLLFAGFCLLTLVPIVKRHPVIFAILFLAVSFTLELLGGIFISGPLFTFALFLWLAVAGFVIVMSKKTEDFASLIKYITISSFTVLTLTIIIVIIIISQGEALDGFDGGVTLDGSANKKQSTDIYSFTETMYERIYE